MTKLLLPLVGAHFRPPAKFVLASLPAGTRLSLCPEPENPYDPEAVQVLLSGADIPESCYGAINEAVLGTGSDIDTILANEVLHLGYLPRVTEKQPKGNRDAIAMAALAGWDALACKLKFSGDDKPLVEIEGLDDE